MDIFVGRNKEAFSDKDLAHMQVWLGDPSWLDEAKAFAQAAKLRDTPNGGLVVWTITGGFRMWGGNEPFPTHAFSCGDKVPVVAIKL